MLPYKRDQLLIMLGKWLQPDATFFMSEFASLTGTLQDHSRTCLWGTMFILCIME